MVLLQELKDWRRRTADELQQPIYRIMNNQLLENISKHRPIDAIQLSLLPGIGPFKLAKYGPKIVELVRKHTPADFSQAVPSMEGNEIDTTEFWQQAKALKKPKPKKSKKTGTDESKRVKSSRKKIEVMTEEEKLALADSSRIDCEELNKEQQVAANYILAGNNVFITGSAGTGKTHLLRYTIQELIREYGEEAVAVTAPTGIAAINIGGQTIHSFAGIGLGTN